MTDLPITPIDDITVTGQRARGPSPFADLDYPSKGPGQGPGGPDQDELDPNGPGPDGPSDESVQCGNPDGKREWNKDAAAAAAIQAMLDYAQREPGEGSLSAREFGAAICQFSNGSIGLGPIKHGPPMIGDPDGRGSVDVRHDDCGSAIPLGYIHSHPSLNRVPSMADFGVLEEMAYYSAVPRGHLSVYTVTTVHKGPGDYDYGYGISGTPLTDKEAVEEQESNYEPKWVNPEAQKCPGAPNSGGS